MNRGLKVVALACMSAWCLLGVSVKAQQIKMPYGKGNVIIYNLKSGTFDLFRQNKLVFADVGCYYVVQGKGTTASANKITCTEKVINDAFGEGRAYNFTHVDRAGLRVMQIFYTYPKRNYFLTQIIIAGNGGKLSSNNIEPINGQLKPIGGDQRSLFVPFDNDTFISYESKTISPSLNNSSSEVLAAYDNLSRHGFITGSVEHENWKTGIIHTGTEGQDSHIIVRAGFTEESITRDDIPHGMVKGDMIVSPKVLVGYYDDWRTGMEDFGKANRIAEPPFVYNWTKPTPVGWNSWGVMQDKLTYDKALKVIHFFADSLRGFRSGSTAFVDLDSFWDRMMSGRSDFSKLKQFADSCKANGLQPGIYWAPFTDWGWKGGPDRKVEGSTYTYGDLWTKIGDKYHELDGARSLDPTHPGTQQRIDYFIGKFKDCGFTMIKIDFLGHAAVESTGFYDTTVTTGMQAYRKGMEYLIHALGNQMLIYAAISPSMATGRYVHTRRIACDAFKTIQHTEYTLNSVSYGWWQTFLYNYIDADHVVLANEAEGANRARFLSALITGTCITGDDFSVHGQWSQRAEKLYQDPELMAIVEDGRAFMPVGTAAGKTSAEVFTRSIGKAQYVAVFNYGNEAKHYRIPLDSLGLSTNEISCRDLLSKHNQMVTTALEVDIPASDATIIKLYNQKK